MDTQIYAKTECRCGAKNCRKVLFQENHTRNVINCYISKCMRYIVVRFLNQKMPSVNGCLLLFGLGRFLAQSLLSVVGRQRTGYFKTLPFLSYFTFVKSTSADPFLFAPKRPDRFLPLCPKALFGGNKSCHLMTARSIIELPTQIRLTQHSTLKMEKKNLAFIIINYH